jgi:hypothetical protein
MEPKGERLLRIGELAHLVDLDPQTLRNYERQRLLKPLTRSEAGHHRLYGQEEVAWAHAVRGKGNIIPVSRGRRGRECPALTISSEGDATGGRVEDGGDLRLPG